MGRCLGGLSHRISVAHFTEANGPDVKENLFAFTVRARFKKLCRILCALEVFKGAEQKRVVCRAEIGFAGAEHLDAHPGVDLRVAARVRFFVLFNEFDPPADPKRCEIACALFGPQLGKVVHTHRHDEQRRSHDQYDP